ncbi:Uncharacterised protein [Serratia proteamaculans]|nr:Uncharacterised protein [Serratia proteamaculans]
MISGFQQGVAVHSPKGNIWGVCRSGVLGIGIFKAVQS